MTESKREFFDIYIAKGIEPVPSPDSIAQEWLYLKKIYGPFITRELFCEAKGISVPTLASHVKQYNRNHPEATK
ncbi:hypothetical protein ACWOEH_05260 [Enterococcus nangangensis]